VEYVLTTERLTLVPATRADLPVLLSHWRDPEVRRFLFDDEVLAEHDVAAVLAASDRDFASSGYGLWLIRETATNALAGTAGLRPLEEMRIEVTYSLAPAAWGRGYATEAARAVIATRWTRPGCPRYSPRWTRATRDRAGSSRNWA
jgi:RimJ/RimL family protein N-acetyltransferase